jgi:transposase
MEAFEVVRVFVNKTVVSNVSMRRRRGNPGYPRLQAVRLLVYAKLKGVGTDKGLVRHLERNRLALGALGFKRVPHRTTVGRWWRRYAEILKKVFEMLADLLQHPLPCKLLVVDSTPLEDRRDPEAEWGYTSRGPFKGFKLHVAVNQEGLPLKALMTPGNRYDSPFLPDLIQGLTPSLVVADAGYDSKENREAVKEAGAEPVIASNPRRKGRQKHRLFSKGKQYLVEQFHDLFKNQILQGCWKRGEGLRRKTGQVYAALTGLLVTAFKALINEEESLRKVSVWWN